MKQDLCYVFFGTGGKGEKELTDKLKSIKGVCVNTYNSFVEILKENVSKGDAVKYICNKLNIDTHDAIAIGDSHNDVSMLDVVGHPVIMKNANKSLFKEGRFITDDVKNSGVAKALLSLCYQ